MRALPIIVALVSWSALASARALTMAIAPMTTGQSAPPEMQQAFSTELPIALAGAGFSLVPPNQVDMKIGERPEFLQCRAGGCLAEEAAFLKVDRLAVPRLEPAPDGSCTVGVAVYDVGLKKIIGDGVDRVVAAGDMHERLTALADKLHAELSRPGRVEVNAEPAAALTVDGEPKGSTPWAGELDAGDHVIALESGGARVERDVNIAPGGTARVDISLAGSAPARHHRDALRPLKWATLVGGALAVGAGAALFAIDGRGTCTRTGAQRQCPDVYDTRTGGIVALAGGAALVATSIVLFIVDRPRHR